MGVARVHAGVDDGDQDALAGGGLPGALGGQAGQGRRGLGDVLGLLLGALRRRGGGQPRGDRARRERGADAGAGQQEGGGQAGEDRTPAPRGSGRHGASVLAPVEPVVALRPDAAVPPETSVAAASTVRSGPAGSRSAHAGGTRVTSSGT